MQKLLDALEVARRRAGGLHVRGHRRMSAARRRLTAPHRARATHPRHRSRAAGHRLRHRSSAPATASHYVDQRLHPRQRRRAARCASASSCATSRTSSREQRPTEVAVEKVFVNVNPHSTLLLGQARGAAIAAAVLAGLPVTNTRRGRSSRRSSATARPRRRRCRRWCGACCSCRRRRRRRRRRARLRDLPRARQRRHRRPAPRRLPRAREAASFDRALARDAAP